MIGSKTDTPPHHPHPTEHPPPMIGSRLMSADHYGTTIAVPPDLANRITHGRAQGEWTDIDLPRWIEDDDLPPRHPAGAHTRITQQRAEARRRYAAHWQRRRALAQAKRTLAEALTDTPSHTSTTQA